MPYICAECLVLWPCTVVDHDDDWTKKQWFPEASEYSMACFVFDHDVCQLRKYCKCPCHRRSDLDEPSITPSHQSLAEQ